MPESAYYNNHRHCFHLPRCLMARHDLRPVDKTVLAVISSHWITNRQCFLSQERIAALSGVTRRTAWAAINHLAAMSEKESIGLITLKRQPYGFIYEPGPNYPAFDQQATLESPPPDVQHLHISPTPDVQPLHISPPPDVQHLHIRKQSDVQHLHIKEGTDLRIKEKTRTDMGAVAPAREGKAIHENKKKGQPMNGKTPDAIKLPAWNTGPHAEFIDTLLTWFQDHHPRPDRQTAARRKAAADVLEKLLRIDLENKPEAPDLVRAVVEWAVQDVEDGNPRWPGWQSNLRSLASLRKPSPNGATKFENIRAKYEQGKNKSTVDSMGLTQADYDQVIAASMARREKRRK